MRSSELLVLDEQELGYAEIVQRCGFSLCESLVLVALAVNGESTARDLERMTQVKVSSVCTSIIHLEELGMVRRRKPETEAGRSILLVSLTGDLVELVSEHCRQLEFKKLSVCSKAAAKSRDFDKRPVIRHAGKERSRLSMGGVACELSN